jgi:hypothetical protein
MFHVCTDYPGGRFSGDQNGIRGTTSQDEAVHAGKGHHGLQENRVRPGVSPLRRNDLESMYEVNGGRKHANIRRITEGRPCVRLGVRIRRSYTHALQGDNSQTTPNDSDSVPLVPQHSNCAIPSPISSPQDPVHLLSRPSVASEMQMEHGAKVAIAQPQPQPP